MQSTWPLTSPTAPRTDWRMSHNSNFNSPYRYQSFLQPYIAVITSKPSTWLALNSVANMLTTSPTISVCLVTTADWLSIASNSFLTDCLQAPSATSSLAITSIQLLESRRCRPAGEQVRERRTCRQSSCIATVSTSDCRHLDI